MGRAILARDFRALMKTARVDQEQYGMLTRRILNAVRARGEPLANAGARTNRRATA